MEGSHINIGFESRLRHQRFVSFLLFIFPYFFNLQHKNKKWEKNLSG